MTKLSQTRVNKIQAPGRYHDGHGLYLQVTKELSRSWVYRFEMNQRERWMGLGPAHDITLEEARDGARDARKKVRAGIDPIATAHEARATIINAAAKSKTFREASYAYCEQHRANWSAKHSKLCAARLNEYVIPRLGSLPVSQIAKPLIIDTLRPIWSEKTATASATLGLIEKILDFAKVSGWRDGDNPATWSGNLQYVLPAPVETKHREALPFAEISDFMGELAKIKSVAARALEFTILTAVRSNEALLATWDEINFATKRWTIPAERMKAGREHVVPLSPEAIKLLKALPRDGSPWLFIGTKVGRPLGDNAMRKVLQRINAEMLELKAKRLKAVA
jgi:Phage integrase central domain/Arm DNA-binding domain/Phage integrase family